MKELKALKENRRNSELYKALENPYRYDPDREIYMNALLPDLMAEKALAYLFCEQNLLSEILLSKIVQKLKLDTQYLEKILSDNRHPVSFAEQYLL